MNIISRLFSRCQHEWETKRMDDLVVSSAVTPSQKTKIGEVAYCQCKKCGAWRVFTMKVR